MEYVIEIRWHGRGGQGTKTASLLLADAAFNTGKYIQGFPEYGPERMGAPITAYNRISDDPITVHSNIYEPDYVVVVDDTLLETVDVTAGLKTNGAIVINTTKSEDYLKSVLNLLQSLERDTLASQIHVRLTLQNLVIKNLVNALYQSLGGLMKLQETEH